MALALALRQELGRSAGSLSADPALANRPSRDPRATAIVAACRRLFDALGVWDAVAAESQPILDMVVTDSKLEDATRPTFLTFGGHVEPGEPFAHMVENRRLIDELVIRAEAAGVDLRATAVTTFDLTGRRCQRHARDGGVIEAASCLSPPMARASKLRERAGIATHGWDYDQSGIVVTVGHERDHDGRAEEHFLPAGPFAILPLDGQAFVAGVDREARGKPRRSFALPDDEFHAELEQRFGLHLGEVKAARQAAGLSGRLLRRAILHRRTVGADRRRCACDPSDRGAGLRPGLKDVAALAETIVDAARLDGPRPGDGRRYQRWRRFDTMTMGVATNVLNVLFSNDLPFVRSIRDIGLGIVDRLAAAEGARSSSRRRDCRAKCRGY